MERHQILTQQLVSIANELGWDVHTIECGGVYEAFVICTTDTLKELMPDVPIEDRRVALRLVKDE